MSDPAQPPAQAKSAVSARRCGHCAYLLTGLRDSGTCPECGEAFDLDEIVLFGWLRGTRHNAINTPSTVRSVVLFVISAFGTWFPILFQRLLPSGGMPYSGRMLGFWVACLAIALAIYLFRRLKVVGAGHPPYQVRITPSGFGRRDGVGPIKLTPWSRHYRASMDSLKKGGWHLQIRHRRAWVGIYSGVNLEFEAHPAEAAAVLQRISAWRDASAAPISAPSTSGPYGRWEYERLNRPP